SIGPAGLYPRIGDYDKWAIEWGYKMIPDKDEKSERAILNDWAKEHASNPRFRFLRQRFIPTDPRAQTEDLGDNAMKASEYGIKNLKRILPNLSKWTFEPGEPFDNLDELYEQVIVQLRRYMGHVTTNIGGIYEDPKTYDQPGEVFTPVPKNLQKDAVAFLNKNAFETPQWLLDWKQLKEFNQDQVVEEIRSFQQGVLSGLSGVLDPGRLERMSESTAQLGKDAYTTDELLDDLRKGIWSEIYARKSIDIFRRDLQKVFVETLGNIINGQGGIRIAGLSGRNASALGITNVNVRTSDIISVAKATLRTLKTDINAALPAIADKMTKYHLQDMVERINLILNPKG
ncbi:MAG TPA: zinc-dependent metalloprotease, partial [Puia sp.]|nr:zinc-dependent metalloprotease [Puia sp.]